VATRQSLRQNFPYFLQIAEYTDLAAAKETQYRVTRILQHVLHD
jgi:hypothetical protein